MKKVYLIILIVFIVGVGSFITYMMFRAGFFFNPGNRYDSSNLNYMGVLFVNESDIHAFNEGYSESDACPWGFKHQGLDFFFNNDSNVIAAAPGQVWAIQKHESTDENKYHVRIWIRFNRSTELGYNFEPWTTLESNRELQISMFKVKVGDWVQKGDVIADFLSCNESAHIHFDIVERGKYYCPVKYFSAEGYTQMMSLVHSYQPTWNLCYP
ncbi:MAG: M23 family metallopeptidase [Candidatus Thorarchaeota archaeon]